MNLKGIIYFLILTLAIWSCKKDDAGPDAVIVPPQTLAETATENDAEIRAFLETHFYNYEDFQEPIDPNFDLKIQIDTIAGDNAGKTPLMDQVQSKSVSVSSSNFNLTEDTTVDHTFYYLVAREGIGESLTVADSSFVRYRGTLLDGSSFDGAEQTPVWFDLAQIQGQGAARGFAEGTKEFKTGDGIIDNGDGTFTVDGYGVGLIIMPSGLGYFNAGQTGIPAYSPLIFEIDLYAMNATDHDGDGIPSIDEDEDGDGYLYSDNTDLDTETGLRFANFIDPDDDGDGISTRDEISDDQGNIIIPYPDSDGDGTPDYLDADS